MKKTLSIAALSTVLVFGMAASAMASHLSADSGDTVASAGAAKITIDGAIRQRGAINKASTTKDSPAASYYDGRIRLGIKAQVTSKASAYIQLETGQGDTHDYGWGNGAAAGGGLNMGGFKDTGSLLTPRQAWINYNASSFSIKVGHQLLALGNKVFFDHTGHGDDAIMAYTSVGDTHLAGILIKFDEQNKKDSTDDLDGYVAVATHKFSDNLDGGINWTYLKGGSQAEAIAPGMSMSNIGINANYRQDNLSFLADGEFQFGNLQEVSNVKTKAKGWAAKLGATMDLGAAKVGLLYGYGSGDDNATDNDQHTFVNFRNNTNYDTILIGYRAAVPGQATKHTGLANLSEYQVNMATKTTCPMTGKSLSLFVSATYAQLNKDINTGATMEDKVGTEFDAIAKWSLAPGLFYKVEAGYLFTGGAWKTATSRDPENLYFLRHQLMFKF